MNLLTIINVMEEDEFYFDFDDDELESINVPLPEPILLSISKKDDEIQKLKDFLTEREMSVKLSKYSFDNTLNKSIAFDKLMKYFNTSNKIIVNIFIKQIQNDMTVFFKKQMSHQTNTKRGKYIVETQKKHFLFNCIRNQLQSESKTYAYDYKTYFKKTQPEQVLYTTTSKKPFNKICSSCNSTNLITGNQILTCKDCGSITETEATGVSFMTGGNIGSIGGTSAIQLTKGGKKFFLSDTELGNEGLINRIVEYINIYFETRNESNESVFSIITTFKAFAHNMIISPNIKLSPLDLKLKAIDIIVNKDPEYFLNKFDRVIDLVSAFNVDKAHTNTILGPDVFKGIFIKKLSSQISDNWRTEHLNLFNDIISKLITSSPKNSKILGKWELMSKNDLSIDQIAVLYYLIINTTTKTTITDVANMFNIPSSRISSELSSFKKILSYTKVILPGIKQKLNLK
jgi:hypothetical protein